MTFEQRENGNPKTQKEKKHFAFLIYSFIALYKSIVELIPSLKKIFLLIVETVLDLIPNFKAIDLVEYPSDISIEISISRLLNFSIIFWG